MPSDTFAPAHVDGGAVKRVLNWITGKADAGTAVDRLYAVVHRIRRHSRPTLR